MSENHAITTMDRENRNLVELAVRCKLISPDQEMTILAELIQELQADPGFSVLEIFRRNDCLSPRDIDFLLAVQDHPEIRRLEKTFGKLAIANGFTGYESVEKALDIQARHFRETREHKLIGDILLANQDITLADCTAVLLTQDRIKDECLAEAMNQLAGSELEWIEINKRIGVIAVKNGYLTIQEINQALKQQKLETEQGKPRRYLGEVLKEAFALTDQDVIAILQEQKEYEKQRLNLEKALHLYNSEIKMNRRLGQLFEYRIPTTKLEAFVVKRTELLEEISVHNLQNWIKLAGIRFGIVPDSEIETFLSLGEPGEEFLIARGDPPEQGVDGALEFFFDTGYCPREEDGEPDTVPFVKKGELIARRTPHTEGTPGRDVFGNVIFPDKVNPCYLAKGTGVESADGISYVAAIDGNPVLYRERTLFVIPPVKDPPLKVIEGDVLEDTSEDCKYCNLEIQGTVGHGAVVACNRLTVRQHVLGRIVASGSVEIKGTVGESVTRKDVTGEQAGIESQGNVVVSRNIENAMIVTKGSFQAPGADVISSVILAQGGMVVKNVYSRGKDSSLLRIGRHETGRLVEINQLLDHKEQILRLLRHDEEHEGMADRLQHQVKVQEEYEEQQSALGFMRSMLGFADIETPAVLDDLLSNFKGTLGFARGSKAHEFLHGIVERFAMLPLEQKQEAVQALLDKKSGMYRAAVNATQRLKAEYQATMGVIEQRIGASAGEIETLETEIASLSIEKDFFLMDQEKGFLPFSPEIKVRNMIEKGTILKGERASLVIGRTMYGVKLREVRTPDLEETTFVIQGYFE
ncbi:MAG: DUF342 domain-containing protein [Desulfobacteraceae bacterium]|nr:DUF342 domain-containing protein [Desulfobacteraceae bacterium]